MKRPLNGEKTHPLSAHAREVLRILYRQPMPTQKINAGVIDRLLREDLIEIVPLPSPFVIHKGGDIRHARITDAGRAVLSE